MKKYKLIITKFNNPNDEKDSRAIIEYETKKKMMDAFEKTSKNILFFNLLSIHEGKIMENAKYNIFAFEDDKIVARF